ncbi:hypothetical protein ACFQHO_32675 [Actinomadura yumaensis]|uniref:hypothetical protein n=1 Tax=Actinomadura yumaensis TaxID=111807 RepID=UPI003619F482
MGRHRRVRGDRAAPFGSGTFESIFYKIMQGTPDLDGVPDGLLPLLRSAMARHPAERPTAVSLVQLARRIHFEATITDTTRVDEHYTRPDGTSQPLDQPLEQPLDKTEADHSRQFSMPAPGPSPSDTPAPAPAPTPVPAPTPAPAQPKDFKGMLPPAAPPPVPPPGPSPYEPSPYEQPGYDRATGYSQGGPYGPPNQGGYNAYDQSGYAPYGQQRPPTQPHPAALQRGPEQGGPYDPAAQGTQQRPDQRADQRADRRGRDESGREPSKPYGWYRVLSVLVLVALLGFANIAPLLAVGVTVVGVLVLRMGDKAAKGMEGKRTRRGPRSGDAVAAAFKTPLHLPGALMVTVLLAPLSAIAGLILLAVLMFAYPDMTASRAIAYSAMAVIALLSLAPGSGAPRRQMARLWGALLPRTEAALAGVLILGIFAAVLVALSQKQPPTPPR